MTGDEIRFEDVRTRELLVQPRPDRNPELAALVIANPSPQDLPIFLDHEVALAIDRHASSDLSVELGGVLLGKECLDPETRQPHVLITASLEAAHYKNTQASFTYTHESWEAITRERENKHPDCDVVGWYHTHPNFGIFLSHHDLFIHNHFFATPTQVAYVVDPINRTRGFFQWRDGSIVAVSGFHLTSSRGQRSALARAADQLENVATEEAAAGLSLNQAELLHMLTRIEHRSAASTREITILAAISGAMGVLVGGVLLAVLLLLARLADRGWERANAPLAEAVEHLADGQRLAMDALADSLGGSDARAFTARYARTAQERDSARKSLGAERQINEALALETASLKTKLAETIASFEARKAENARLSDLVLSIAGKDAATLERELAQTRYSAYAGWGAFSLLALGTISLYLRGKPSGSSSPP